MSYTISTLLTRNLEDVFGDDAVKLSVFRFTLRTILEKGNLSFAARSVRINAPGYSRSRIGVRLM